MKNTQKPQLIIFDTTLRDGEQCPGAAMNLREKLAVARQLARLRVDVIEAGFPIASQGDFAAVQAIAREIKGPVIAALARCLPADIDRAAAAVKPAGKHGRIHIFLGASPIHRQNLNKTPGQIIEMVMASVKHARTHTADVQFSPMDATRTEPDFLLRVCQTALAAGATTINIPDTAGWAMPEQFGALIKRLYNTVPEFHSGQAVISVHCHNDLGLAVANSLAAVRDGARQVECTVNGIGERAGNASLEELVMAVKTRTDFFGDIICGVNTREILKSSRLVERLSGLAVPRNKAIVGANAFAHGSGIHQDGQLKNRQAFEIMEPRTVGWGQSELPLTKHSGRASMAARLRRLGYQMTGNDVNAIFAKFKEIGDKKKFVYDDDLAVLVEGHLAKTPEVWRLEYLSVTTGTGAIPTATVRLRQTRVAQPGAETLQEAGTGDGPIDAVVKTINLLTGTKGELVEFSVRAASRGVDALAEATVKVDFGNSRVITGRGTSTDTIEATARAYLHAVNRCLAQEGDRIKKKDRVI